jgi:hypothetical protein
MRPRLLLLATLLPLLTRAGGEDLPFGARIAGMGNAGITLVDLYSVRHNQAGLAGLDKPVAGLYYQQHWLSNDLAMQGLAFALPLGNGTIAATGNSFGYDLYREQKFGLAYAMRFGDGLRVGVQMDYLNVQLGENYGSRSAVTVELGVQAKLTDALWIGAHLYNPNQASISLDPLDRAPTLLRAGMGYTFNEKVLMTVEAEKDIDMPERYHVGMEYHPVNALYLRAGISTGPVQSHFGVGVHVGQVDIDMAVAVRSQLGTTPMLNLNYRFK